MLHRLSATRLPSSMASPQGLCARQRFGGHNENTGYATSLRRAMGTLRVRNSPGESRFALCHSSSPVKLICTHPIGERISEESRVGKVCVRTCRFRGEPCHETKKQKT